MKRWPWRGGCVRFGLASGVLLGAFACLPVTSAQASFANSEFIITLFGSSTTVVLQYSELQNLMPDVSNQSYQVISSPGGTAQTVTVSSGYSLGEILNLAEIAPSSFNYAEITAGAAESTLLTAAQATSPATSADPPVFYEDGANQDFADSSPTGYISGSGLVYVNLYPGPQLKVSIKASPSHVTAGKDVKLTATVSGQTPGASMRYQWDNGTGLTYGGGSPLSHPFAIPGTYYAYATVSGSDGSVGISPEISFEIGKAPKGPNRNGGGASKKKKAPTSGPGTRGSPNGKSATGKGKSTTGNGKTSSGTSTTTTASATTTPPPTATTPAKQTPSHHVSVKRAPRPAGPLLSGIALGSIQPAPAASAPSAARAGAVDPARTGHVVARHGLGIGQGFWIALGTLSTLLTGALLEWSGPPRIPPRARVLIARFH